jgi:hypothetical protein
MYRVTPWHGEGPSLFFIVFEGATEDSWEVQSSFRNRSEADHWCGMLNEALLRRGH